MAIRWRYDNTISVYREDFVGASTVKKAFVEVLADIPCVIHPLEAALAQGMTGSFGKAWIMLCGVRDIREGDKVVTPVGTAYKVASVETFDFPQTRNSHMEVTLRLFAE